MAEPTVGKQIIILLNRHWYYVFFSVLGSICSKRNDHAIAIIAFIVTFLRTPINDPFIEIETMQATMTDDYRYAYLDLSNDIKRLLPWYTHDSRKNDFLDSKWIDFSKESTFNRWKNAQTNLVLHARDERFIF